MAQEQKQNIKAIPGAMNPFSINENEKMLIFPSASTVQNEIPLWLKFTCCEYSAFPLARSGVFAQTNPAGFGAVKARIHVPAPTKLVNQTAMRYKNEENDIIKPIAQDFLEQKLQNVFDRVETAIGAIAAQPLKFAGAIAGVADVALDVTKQFSQMIDSDFTETILQSGSRRSFQFQLYLPCLNSDDSLRASSVARAFEALALPTMINLAPGGAISFGQFTFHPPMWFFSLGPLNSVQSDGTWASQPQASVLTNVAVNRTAIDASSFTALDLNIKPFAYSITLNFLEIEPAIRITNGGNDASFLITNRSGAGTSSYEEILSILPGLGS